MSRMPLPKIIQGGMGAGVSGWPLANAVSRLGQLGVVAGTALDGILARRLQLGDPGGHVRRALENFPIAGVAQRILDRYFIPGGKKDDAPFRSHPVMTVNQSRHLQELTVAGNFVEVFLAREGHDNPVGINFLEKIQLPTLSSLFGAMLAGVDVVLMGAGIPTAVPGILDRLADGEAVELRLDVKGAAPNEEFRIDFDPREFCGGDAPALTRPRFLAIISSATIARRMAKKASGRVDGFVVEGPSAGGHIAPPRGRPQLSETNEPVYGERDRPDLEAIRSLGLPFWLAGSFARPELLAEALELGAAGVQVGTAFAYCEESGIVPALKSEVIEESRRGAVHVHTDPLASPTGYPFKVVQLAGTLSEQATNEARPRRCDVGILRHAYVKADGELGWRCPGEPVDAYLRKEGELEETVGRKCVCNGLLATVGLGQTRKDGYRERPLVTAGTDVADVARFLPEGAGSYRAADVVDYLLCST